MALNTRIHQSSATLPCLSYLHTAHHHTAARIKIVGGIHSNILKRKQLNITDRATKKTVFQPYLLIFIPLNSCNAATNIDLQHCTLSRDTECKQLTALTVQTKL